MVDLRTVWADEGKFIGKKRRKSSSYDYEEWPIPLWFHGEKEVLHRASVTTFLLIDHTLDESTVWN